MATYDNPPTRPRHTHSVNYPSPRMKDCRNTLTLDVPKIVEVTKGSLIDSVLTLVPTSEVEQVCIELCSTSQISDEDPDNPRWVCLPEDPGNSKRHGIESFQFFEKIVEAVDSCRPNKSQELQLKFSVSENTTPLGQRHNTSRPDGYFYLAASNSSLVRWADILLPMEFKNKDTLEKRVDNRAKLIWSMHRIMRTDAQRRYVLGLTCENTTARLWYNDRSDIVASDTFDINKDWKYLVRIILSMLVATRVDTGYDPSIVTFPAINLETEPKYDITIYNNDAQTTNVYRTIEMISGVGADSMVGRGTRVWKCQRVENGKPTGPFYAIKVVWVHPDRPAEHILLQEIRKEQPKYSKHFLTVVDYGFAPLSLGLPSTPFNTHNPLGRSKNLEPTGISLSTRVPPRSNHTSNTSKDTSGHNSRDSPGHPEDISNSSEEGYHGTYTLSECPRQCYLVVFKEIGEPVHKLPSSGNILLVPKDDFEERGVIMDLEYCNSTKENKPQHEVQAGTETFMATEVALMEHHRLYELRLAAPQLASMEALKHQDAKADANPSLDETPLPSFRYNALHDMESVWWLCTWIMLYFIHPKEDASAWQEQYRAVFRSPATKLRFLLHPNRFKRYASHLSNLPESQSLVAYLQYWLKILDNTYSIAYTQQDKTYQFSVIEIDPETINDAYDLGRRQLLKLRELSEKLTFALAPLPRLLEAACREAGASATGNSFEPKAGGSSVANSSGRIMPPPKKRRYVYLKLILFCR
ncbi:TBC1 domain family member 31 [Rhizoctonia solani]|uniref:TBC1 domain family member 31 n=1 Tax=Rhizoctonia solani TaxID=456999 RepID=A0A0K6GHD0_9AGAM|nr:TBC1 domain family member 31 [Rhizoctonia solani]